MIILPSTNRQLHALLSQTGNMSHKADLVYSFTSGRTDSSSQMTDDEARALIFHLQQLGDDKANRMRKKVLAIAHTLQWYEEDGGALVLKNGRPVLDMKRIDAFCTQRGPFKKPLQQHTAKELTTLVTVFEKL